MLCLGIAVLIICIRDNRILDAIENRMYDMRVKLLSLHQPPSNDIVIVGIDDYSLSFLAPEIGRWPWPRYVYGGIIDYCASASTIAFDIIFAEENENNKEGDKVFTNSAKHYGKVISALYLSNAQDTGYDIPIESISQFSLPASFSPQITIDSYEYGLIPFPNLLAASNKLGTVQHEVESDGVLRTYTLAAKYHERFFPSLGLAAAMTYLGLTPQQVSCDVDSNLHLGDRQIPLANNKHLRLLPPNVDDESMRHKTYRVVDILTSWYMEKEGKQPIIPRDTFKDKIVLVGSLAIGVKDREIIAGGFNLDGVLVHAIAVDNLLNSKSLQLCRPFIEFLIVLIICLLPVFASIERPGFMVMTIALILTGYLGIVIGALFLWHVILPVTAPVLGIMSSSIGLGVSYWYIELVQRKKLEFNLREAYEDLKITNEKLADYSHTLEIKVDERTKEITEKNVELEGTLNQLKQMQEQLIMQEKLASLGQVTAGIAHEIKNPLNFVNNFSKVSISLTEELEDEIQLHKDKLSSTTNDFILEIITDLKSNIEKINNHGNRADRIVRGMLVQYRGNSGGKEKTGINALIDDNLNLMYHGKRADEPTFDIVQIRDYDESIGEITVMPQELGRAFLNILNNAFYSTHQKKKKLKSDYNPQLTVRTKNCGDRVEIRIHDNGMGIPTDIMDKIFNPFFTTKPTGEGTGLGLSIAFEIIVQAHKGTLRVESEINKYAEFIITLPKISD